MAVSSYRVAAVPQALTRRQYASGDQGEPPGDSAAQTCMLTGTDVVIYVAD